MKIKIAKLFMQEIMKIKTKKVINSPHCLNNNVVWLPLRVFSKEISEVSVTVPREDIIRNNLVMIHMYKHI